jgi:hypothetical protein
MFEDMLITLIWSLYIAYSVKISHCMPWICTIMSHIYMDTQMLNLKEQAPTSPCVTNVENNMQG